MSDQQTAPESQPTEAAATTTETPQIDNAALMGRMDELAQTVQKLVPQQTEPDHTLSDYAFQPFEAEAQTEDPYGQAEDPYAQQQPDLAALANIVNQQVNQALSPLMEQQRAQMIHQQAVALEQRYPDLAKPEVAGQVVKEARRFAEQIGYANGFSTEQVATLARSPQLIEQLFMAQRAQAQAQQETPAGATPDVQLEGAAAQVETPEQDLGDRIVNAGPATSGFRWH